MTGPWSCSFLWSECVGLLALGETGDPVAQPALTLVLLLVQPARHRATEPGVRRDALQGRLLLHPGLDALRQPERDPRGSAVVLHRRGLRGSGLVAGQDQV